jgi:hypothetical protein
MKDHSYNIFKTYWKLQRDVLASNDVTVPIVLDVVIPDTNQDILGAQPLLYYPHQVRTPELLAVKLHEVDTESWSCAAGVGIEIGVGAGSHELEHGVVMAHEVETGAGAGARHGEITELEYRDTNFEKVELEHISSPFDLVSWLHQGPYEDENGSLASSDEDAFFQDSLL